MPPDDLTLRNSLRDSTALLDYAAKLAAVPVPDVVTREGVMRLAIAGANLGEACRVLGVPVDGKTNAA